VSLSLYETYKDALRRGHVAALRSRFDTAIAAYGEAATIAPDRPLPHAAIGGIMMRTGRAAEAAEAYDRALALGPRDEAALRGRAEAMIALERPFEAAVALDRLADVLDAAGRLAQACDAARRALELAESKDRRRNVEALAGRLRLSAGDEAAELSLARALRILEPVEVVEPSDAEPGRSQSGAPSKDLGETEVVEAELPAEAESAVAAVPPPEPAVPAEPTPEPVDAMLLGAAAEDALAAGDHDAALAGLLAAAAAHRTAGRSVAAIDACYLALAIAPADVDLHLLLAELYLERGWRAPAADKLVLLARLASLADDGTARERICRLATEHLPDEARLADLCA
jgi:tetratricopeptide (TPR) repeat protein